MCVLWQIHYIIEDIHRGIGRCRGKWQKAAVKNIEPNFNNKKKRRSSKKRVDTQENNETGRSFYATTKSRENLREI